MVANVLEKVGGSLVPPGIHPELWWKLVVSGLLFTLILFSVWAIGFTGGGFALAGDVDKVRKHQLAQRLDNVHAHLCMEQAGDSDRQLIDLARELEFEYQEVNNGQPYQVNCSLLLKLRR